MQYKRLLRDFSQLTSKKCRRIPQTEAKKLFRATTTFEVSVSLLSALDFTQIDVMPFKSSKYCIVPWYMNIRHSVENAIEVMISKNHNVRWG
jgi:hypothetical protein